ncbi:MAG: hypothetical protein JW809_09665 [Pirellulales bacterium]|nr:hypothetical protein [Pirellulales bacterium]
MIHALRLPIAILAVVTADRAAADAPRVLPAPEAFLLSPLQAGAGLLQLAQLPAVQRELELTPRQVADVAKVARRFPPDRRWQVPLIDNAEVFPEDLDGTQAEIARHVRQVLTYRQWTRLNQLRLQSLGVGALFTPEVELSLGITPRQRLLARKIVTRARSYTHTLLADHAGGKDSGQIPAEVLSQIRQTWEDAKEKGFELLTEQQRLILADIMGEPFEF